MGGGNGQKSKMAREKRMEKNKAPKGSQLESNKKAMTIQTQPATKPRKIFPGQVIFECFICGICFKFMEWSEGCINHPCKVCMQTFICTTSEVKCREHAEAKHPKSDPYQCFPHLKE